MTDVDALLRNAELRTALEPYYDESIFRVHFRHRNIRVENDFLACMLDWEVSPIKPISQWFEPELKLPPAESLTDEQLQTELEKITEKLFEKRLVLDFTEHLSDRELYTMIRRDILPLNEKNMRQRNGYIHWDCTCGDNEVWLRYYASDEERREYRLYENKPLPPKQLPPYYRDLPVPEI